MGRGVSGWLVGGIAESALFYWRNPEWPEIFERNAKSRVDGGSGIWEIFEAESENGIYMELG